MYVSHHSIDSRKPGQSSSLPMYPRLKSATVFLAFGFMSLVSIPAVYAENQQTMDLPQISSQPDSQLQRQQLRDQLLTAEERNNFNQKMQSATSQKERKMVRARQRKLLKQRAKAKGISLPEESQSKGKGRRNGAAGNGSGSGFGRNRF